MSEITGSVAGGTASSDWRADWSVSPPRYTGTGTFSGISADRLTGAGPSASLMAFWITGKTNVTYSLELSGNNEAEIVSSAKGKAEFTVANGTSRALALDPAKLMRFRSLQGALELDRQILKVLPSKLKAENRIYEFTATVSLSDQQAKLKARACSAESDITGTLEKPRIVARPLANGATYQIKI